MDSPLQSIILQLDISLKLKLVLEVKANIMTLSKFAHLEIWWELLMSVKFAGSWQGERGVKI